MSTPQGNGSRNGTTLHDNATRRAALTIQAWVRQRLMCRRAHRLLLWLHLLQVAHRNPDTLCTDDLSAHTRLSTSLADAAVLHRLLHAAYSYEAAIDTENYTRALLLEELLCQSDVARRASAQARWQLRQRHPAVRRQALSTAAAMQILREGHSSEPAARQHHAIPALLQELEGFLGLSHFEWWRLSVASTPHSNRSARQSTAVSPAVHHDAAMDVSELHERRGGDAELQDIRPAPLHMAHSSAHTQSQTARSADQTLADSMDENDLDEAFMDAITSDDCEHALNAAYVTMRERKAHAVYEAAERATLAGCPLIETPPHESSAAITITHRESRIPALATTAEEDQYLPLVRRPVLGAHRSEAGSVVVLTDAAAAALVCVVCELDGTVNAADGDGDELLLPCCTCEGLVHASCACEGEGRGQQRRFFCCSHCRTAAAAGSP